MITTVKLKQTTKHDLDKLKADSESYDDVIQKLVNWVGSKDLKKRLIEGYKSLGSDDIDLLEEWEPASREL